MSFWTQERTETLTKLWEEGQTASTVARMLSVESGKLCTRNMVISKAHRLKLTRRVNNALINKIASRKTRRAKLAPKAQKQIEARILKLRVEPIPPPRETDVARIKSIVDLEPHHCKWPVGTPGTAGFGFCGDKRIIGLPYCVHHNERSVGQKSRLPEIERMSLGSKLPKTKVFEEA